MNQPAPGEDQPNVSGAELADLWETTAEAALAALNLEVLRQEGRQPTDEDRRHLVRLRDRLRTALAELVRRTHDASAG